LVNSPRAEKHSTVDYFSWQSLVLFDKFEVVLIFVETVSALSIYNFFREGGGKDTLSFMFMV